MKDKEKLEEIEQYVKDLLEYTYLEEDQTKFKIILNIINKEAK